VKGASPDVRRKRQALGSKRQALGQSMHDNRKSEIR
jgi:hypothetical protein